MTTQHAVSADGGQSDPVAVAPPPAAQALRRAAIRVAIRLAEGGGGRRSADEIAAHMVPFVERIWRSACGDGPAETNFNPPLPLGVLLDALRTELLDELALLGSGISSSETVAVLLALEAARARLESDPTHRFTGRFTGSAGIDALVEVAHDMRSPLSSIVLLVETLRQQHSGPVNEVQERQLALVYGAAFGLSLLANDVIELSRGADRLVDAHKLPFSISDILGSVREIVQPIAEEKGVEVRLVLPEADWRMGYPTALHRVLLNLTTNALKFTNEGFVEVSAVQCGRTGMEFAVRDTGRGIPEPLLLKIFDAFREPEQTGRHSFSSSGLGLSICRKLVSLMAGEIHVHNMDDCGSRFVFRIEMPRASRYQ